MIQYIDASENYTHPPIMYANSRYACIEDMFSEGKKVFTKGCCYDTDKYTTLTDNFGHFWFLNKEAAQQHFKFLLNYKDLYNIKKEMVNHPDHYKGNKFEVIDIIEDYNLDFVLGNAVKYILRAGKKDDTIQDLKKSIWYIERHIKKLEGVNE